MAGDVTALKTRLAAIDAELAGIVVGNGKPGSMPNASGAGNIQDVQYRMSLYDERDRLLKAISIADGPWEMETRSPW